MSRRFAISCLFVALALSAPARTRPHYGGILRVEIEGDPWQRPNGVARRLVYDGLTVLNRSGDVRPALAVTWESDNKDHRWQFHLRPGVHFHDGSPLTSVAAAASLTASCSTDCPWTSVRSVGPAVVFTSDSPMPNLPALLAGDRFLIGLTINADGKTPTSALGTGPFQLAGLDNGVLSLKANEDCWQGRPFAEGIQIGVRRPVHDQWLDLSVGRADVVEVPAELLRQAQQQHLTLVESPAVSLLALQVSNTGPLANIKLREAIAAAVDRGALFNVIFQKQGEITASLLPQSLTGYSFLFPTDRDLNGAHELRGGQSPPLTLSAEGDGAMQLAAQRIALNLREAGFNVQMAGANPSHVDLFLRILPIDARDPSAALELMLANAGQPAPVIEKTPAAIFNVEKNFLSQKTLIPLLDLPRAYAIGSRVRDFKLLSDGTSDFPDASLAGAQ